MNLKEAFRYQGFLGRILEEVGSKLSSENNCLTITKRYVSSSDGEILREESTAGGGLYDMDKLADLLIKISEEKIKLSQAIFETKIKLREEGCNIDADLEREKYLRAAEGHIHRMLLHKGYSMRSEATRGQYMELIAKENYDRVTIKKLKEGLEAEYELLECENNARLMFSKVEYDPPFNINDTLEEIIEAEEASKKM